MDFFNFTDVCGRQKTMLAEFLAAAYELSYSPTYLCLHILQFYRQSTVDLAKIKCMWKDYEL